MKIKDLRAAKHPDYDSMLADGVAGGALRVMRLVHGLYAAGDAWRAHIEHWLPRSEVEPDGLYEDRKRRALYEPIYPVIVNLTLGSLFAEPPSIEGLDAAVWDRLSVNADGAQTSFSDVMRNALRDAINMRCAYLWVDVGRGDEVADRASEIKRASESVRLRSVSPMSVQNWIESGGVLDAILIAEVVDVVTDVVAPATRTWRWTAIDKQAVRRWEWTAKPSRPEPDDNDDAEEVESYVHGYGRVPVLRLALKEDHWLGARLLDPATALTRASNELSWALYRANSELLTIASKQELATPRVGQGYWLQLSRDADGADRAEYVAPSGRTIAALAEEERNARTALFRVAQHLQLAADPSAATTRQSADSKAKDWEVTAVLLESYGDAILDFIREVGMMVADVVGSTGEVVASGIRGEDRRPDSFLANAAMAVDLKQASPTAAAEIAKRIADLLLGGDLEDDAMRRIADECDAFYSGQSPGTGAGVDPNDDEDEDGGTGSGA